MNILILSPSLKVGGGAEKFSAIIGNEFYQKGHKIFHLTFFDEDNLYDFQGKYFTLNDKKGQKGNFKGIISLIRKSAKIKKICSNNKISVVIAVGENQNYHAVISKYIFKNQVKIIATQHINPKIYSDNKISVNMTKFLYPKADIVVCVSKALKNILKNTYGINNTKTIYNFLSMEIVTKKSKEDLPERYMNIFKSGFIFINIGRLTEQKGQWFLIRSFKKVVENYKNAKLFIIGEGELKKDLKDLIKILNLENNVFILGNQTNVFPFLLRSDCFVLTSIWEGFPITLIEALSMGLPVMSVDCETGPRECLCPELSLEMNIDYPYYGNTGILLKPVTREFVFENLDDNPLNSSELIIFNSMLKMIEDYNILKRYSTGLKFNKKMDETQIIQEWEKLIYKL